MPARRRRSRAASKRRRARPSGHRVVVVVGDAVGGLSCAQRLAKRGGVEVRLIDRTLRATEAVVTQIDLAAGKLATSVGTVGFDELLLAAGAALAPESVPGLSEAAHGFYTREDATRLRDALVSFGGGRVLVVVAAMAFKCRRAVGMLLPKAGVFAHAESEVRSSPTTRRCSGRQARRRVLRRPQWMLSGDRRRPAGFASGDFYAAPAPAVRMLAPARRWHWGKIRFERRWLARLR